MPRSHIHWARTIFPARGGGVAVDFIETVGYYLANLISAACVVTYSTTSVRCPQKLEEFNGKASVISMAGRRAAIVRAPHG